MNYLLQYLQMRWGIFVLPQLLQATNTGNGVAVPWANLLPFRRVECLRFGKGAMYK